MTDDEIVSLVAERLKEFAPAIAIENKEDLPVAIRDGRIFLSILMCTDPLG